MGMPPLEVEVPIAEGGEADIPSGAVTSAAVVVTRAARRRRGKGPAFWLAVDAMAIGFTIWASIPLADMAVHPVSVVYNWIAAGTT